MTTCWFSSISYLLLCLVSKITDYTSEKCGCFKNHELSVPRLFKHYNRKQSEQWCRFHGTRSARWFSYRHPYRHNHFHDLSTSLIIPIHQRLFFCRNTRPFSVISQIPPGESACKRPSFTIRLRAHWAEFCHRICWASDERI